MATNNYSTYYFLGIGGIGMSALARYFHQHQSSVFGCDKVRGPIAQQLEEEGITIIYDDSLEAIPLQCRNPKECLIVYTPAVPPNNLQLQWFQQQNFSIKKRAEVLGLITQPKQGLAVAGTHGKTTVSTMLAHIFYQSALGCSAFLGGLAKNYNSNLLINTESPYVVVEADEYDRSFLHLQPHSAIITATDADHLDIYNTHQELLNSFEQFTRQINPKGFLLKKYGITLDARGLKTKVYTYGFDAEADFRVNDIRPVNGHYLFDIQTPEAIIRQVELGMGGLINIENALAASALALLLGVDPNCLRVALRQFQGIWRRFDVQLNNPKHVYIDDYAHHPQELKACINSVRHLYPDRSVTGIFQPHLYTRTRDFASEFAQALSQLDRVILLPIYPAREEAIPGVNSHLIYEQITIDDKHICTKDELFDILTNKHPDILLTLGAGDIDRLVSPLKMLLASF